MEKYFIANPGVNELAVFPDGKAYLLTNKYDLENYANQTKQSYEIVKREDAVKSEETKQETKTNKKK